MSTTAPLGSMGNSVSASIMRRLAFARYVFRLGQRQAESAPPANAAALLSLQDAVELFLLVTCEHRKIQLKQNPTFAEYLVGLQVSYGADVPHSATVQRMNKARVSLKHYGIMPAPDDIRDFAAGTSDFLTENSVMALGVGFNDVSLSDLIKDQEVTTARQRGPRCAVARSLLAVLNVVHACCRSIAEDSQPARAVFTGGRTP